ncbi:MAG: arylamine N-acetyltransferase [Chlorobiaceae bacterium]|nr:arylamine N-acetyltransferase [Chlorobiaceae bacterium]
MNAENFNLQAYLERVGFPGKPSADFETLRRLMRCQLFTVPFENLDVQSGKVVSLIPEEIYRKIVEGGRGGYCYEVNGLFSMALDAIGVPHRLIAARPMTYPARRPKTHMALVVTSGGSEWLFDLGFGSFTIREPLNLARTDCEVSQDDETFRLVMSTQRDYLLQSFTDDGWKNLYEFDLYPQEWVDFEPANYMNSTHPDSIFVREFIVVLQKQNGKDVLLGDRFKSFTKGGTESRMVSQEELPSLLMQKFSLRWPV